MPLIHCLFFALPSSFAQQINDAGIPISALTATDLVLDE
jgi:hypothetical protein